MKFLGIGRGRVSRTRKRPRGLDERKFNHGVLADLDFTAVHLEMHMITVLLIPRRCSLSSKVHFCEHLLCTPVLECW